MLALNTRITLGLTVVLLVVGLAVMLLDRQLYEATLAAHSIGEQIAITLFHSHFRSNGWPDHSVPPGAQPEYPAHAPILDVRRRRTGQHGRAA